jgi:DNA modification methylase
MQVEMRPIGSINPYESNPRVNDGAVEAVAASIKEFGYRVPIVIDEQGVVVCGHTRLKASLLLGLAEVPVHVASGLTPEQIKAYRLADNATNELATWDKNLLPLELFALRELDFDLSLLGFKPDELAKWMGTEAAEGLCDPDEIPEAPEVAITQPGDLWLLGEHRLLCGDSTNSDDFSRLMNGERAACCFTDPPWNVAIGLDSNPRHRQREGLANDNLSPEDFREFLAGFASNLITHLDGDLYCVLGASEWPTLDSVLRECGFHWSATVIWVKDQFVLGRSKYHRRYEPIWYGWHTKNQSSFVGHRDVDDVWEVARPRVSTEHATMKPIELVQIAIANSSPLSGIVIDPFLGSGTTLLAAERLDRRCYGIELSPKYCDVICRRFQNFTGKPAILERTGESPIPLGQREEVVK